MTKLFDAYSLPDTKFDRTESEIVPGIDGPRVKTSQRQRGNLPTLSTGQFSREHGDTLPGRKDLKLVRVQSTI